MKAGILTYHRAVNYGARMQAFALCEYLNALPGVSAELIDFTMPQEKRFYSISPLKVRELKLLIKAPARWLFQLRLRIAMKRGLRAFRLSPESLCSDDPERFRRFVRGKYDVIVAGSDEIWKTDSFRGFPTPYWLEGDLGCRKLGFAVSSRSDFGKLSDDGRRFARDAALDFDYIGARDQTTLDALRALGVERAGLCCDPSLAYDLKLPKADVPALLKKKARKLDPALPNVCVMTESIPFAARLLRELKGRFNLIAVYCRHDGYLNVPDLTPLEWARLIGASDLVITSFFHGVCFSIAQGTPFIAVGTSARMDKIRPLLAGEKQFEGRVFESADAFFEIGAPAAAERCMARFDPSDFLNRQRETAAPFLNALRGIRQDGGKEPG